MKDTYDKAVPPKRDSVRERIIAVPVGKSLLIRTEKKASIRTIVSRLRADLPKAKFSTLTEPGGVRVSRLA